ncbi:MAG TPA: DsrE family protein [Bacteroidales bacterium]|nr:DsrE family protein [Bacteroidales bacterium]
MRAFYSALFCLILLSVQNSLSAQNAPPQGQTAVSDTLVVVWTSGDPEVAEKVCFMYAHNAKKQKWFSEVVLITWGPSAKLASENRMIQEKLAAMKKDGVILQACIACANMYGVAPKLKELGMDVRGMGVPLTAYLKSNKRVITF